MSPIISYFIQGLILGMAMGILPGPVMAVIVAQTLSLGPKSGVKISIGALLMDIIRISAVFIFFTALPQNNLTLGILGLAGGVFLAYFSYQVFSYNRNRALPFEKTESVYLGIIANLLNPSAYVFWLTVGGAMILRAKISGEIDLSFIYILGFLAAVTLINILIALLAGKIKTYLKSNYYIYTLRFMAVVLLFFSFLFFKQAVLNFIQLR